MKRSLACLAEQGSLPTGSIDPTNSSQKTGSASTLDNQLALQDIQISDILGARDQNVRELDHISVLCCMRKTFSRILGTWDG